MQSVTLHGSRQAQASKGSITKNGCASRSSLTSSDLGMLLVDQSFLHPVLFESFELGDNCGGKVSPVALRQMVASLQGCCHQATTYKKPVFEVVAKTCEVEAKSMNDA